MTPNFNQEEFSGMIGKQETGKELEILRRLLLFVQLKAVPPIFNFPKGQGQDSDFSFINKKKYKNMFKNHRNYKKKENETFPKAKDFSFVYCQSPQILKAVGMNKYSYKIEKNHKFC